MSKFEIKKFIKQPSQSQREVFEVQNELPCNFGGSNTRFSYHDLSAQNRELVAVDHMVKVNTANAHILELNAENAFKVELEGIKAKNAMQLEAMKFGRQKYFEDRKDSTTTIVRDSDGKLREQREYANGNIENVGVVLDVPNFKAILMKCESEMVAVIFFLDFGRDFFLLKHDEISAEVFQKKLTLVGISIKVGYNRKKVVAQNILEFLIRNAITTTIPPKYGWNRSLKGWYFVDANFLTADDIREGGQQLAEKIRKNLTNFKIACD